MINKETYLSVIDSSFRNAMHNIIDGKHYNDIMGINIIETALDLGRRTGKTSAMIAKILRDDKRGIVSVVVCADRNSQESASKMFIDTFRKEKHGECSPIIFLSADTPNMTEFFRGKHNGASGINIFMDEANMRVADRKKLIRVIANSMTSVHPYSWIHAIRLGE